tara:strand:- start:254 stop:364 length:111 start_codon:yes stop_codon:yes gene_type:complete
LAEELFATEGGMIGGKDRLFFTQFSGVVVAFLGRFY